MKRSPALWLLVLGMFAVADDAWAQVHGESGARRVEWWGAVTGAIGGPAGALATSYSPPLLLDGDFTSRGGQTLGADTGFAVGWTAGVNVFPTRWLGLQVLIDRASYDVSATNPAYTVALQYVSRQPPNDELQIVNVNQRSAWPDTSGSLTQMAFALNAVVRIGSTDRLGVTVSGGPTVFRLGGDVQPLGFTAFQLGGHSVLFQDDYRLALSVEPTFAFGLDAGAELNVAVGGRAAIVAGYRYFGGRQTDVMVRPSAILNSDELTFQQSLADVASRLALAPMRLSVSGSRVLVGLTLTPD
jgi:hypothetical protein